MYPDKDFERRVAENAERVANLFEDNDYIIKTFSFEADDFDINRIAEGLKRFSIANVVQKVMEE